jgi:hypothetical protein
MSLGYPRFHSCHDPWATTTADGIVVMLRLQAPPAFLDQGIARDAPNLERQPASAGVAATPSNTADGDHPWQRSRRPCVCQRALAASVRDCSAGYLDASAQPASLTRVSAVHRIHLSGRDGRRDGRVRGEMPLSDRPCVCGTRCNPQTAFRPGRGPPREHGSTVDWV